jgi:hypothetical protein
MTERSREAVAAELETVRSLLVGSSVSWRNKQYIRDVVREAAALLRTPPQEAQEVAMKAQQDSIDLPDRSPLRLRLKALEDAAEMLWVVLANVSGGDWDKQSHEWQETAARWRDNYFVALKGKPQALGVDGGSIALPEPDHTGKAKKESAQPFDLLLRTPPREAQEEIETLRRERDEAHADTRQLRAMWTKQIARAEAAEAKLAALALTPLTALVAQWREDAERYRWLDDAATYRKCAAQLAAVLATMGPKP